MLEALKAADDVDDRIRSAAATIYQALNRGRGVDFGDRRLGWGLDLGDLEALVVLGPVLPSAARSLATPPTYDTTVIFLPGVTGRVR